MSFKSDPIKNQKKLTIKILPSHQKTIIEEKIYNIFHSTKNIL